MNSSMRSQLASGGAGSGRRCHRMRWPSRLKMRIAAHGLGQPRQHRHVAAAVGRPVLEITSMLAGPPAGRPATDGGVCSRQPGLGVGARGRPRCCPCALRSSRRRGMLPNPRGPGSRGCIFRLVERPPWRSGAAGTGHGDGSQPRSIGSGVVGPLGERGVVDGHVVAAEQGEDEGVAGGRDAAAAVGHHALGVEGARRLELRAQHVGRQVGVGLGIHQVAGDDVHAAGDAAGPPVGGAARAAMLLLATARSARTRRIRRARRGRRPCRPSAPGAGGA